jgi:hypothetical protein
MRRFSIIECLDVFCGYFIECCSAAEGKLNLERGSSNASLYHLPLPELIERLEKYARRQPSPMFDSCFPPDDNCSENRKRDFTRNIVTSMIKIYGINKNDEARVVSYTASNRKGRFGYFTGIKFYDAVIPGSPTPSVPYIPLTDLFIKCVCPPRRLLPTRRCSSPNTSLWKAPSLTRPSIPRG